MGVPYSQNWDGASPLTGWNQSGTWTVKTSLYPSGLSPTSSPGEVIVSPSSGSVWLTYGTDDGNGGAVAVQSNVNTGSTNTGVVGVTARGSAATLTSSTQQYTGWIDTNTGQVGISVWGSGSGTNKATVTPTLGRTGWGTLTLTCNGSTLTLAYKDRTSGYWLDSSGNWSSTQVNALSVTDSTLSGAGYFGLFVTANAGSFTAGFDDFSATSSIVVDGATAAVTLGAMSASASGTSTNPGSAGITLGHTGTTAAASVSTAASAAPTLGHVSPSAACTFFIPVSAGIALGATSASAPGTFKTTAAPAVTLGSLAVSTTVFGPAYATAAITTGNHAAAVLGNNGCFAAASPTLGGLGSAGSAFAGYFASAGITLGATAISAAATWANTAAVGITLGSLSAAGVGIFEASGTGATALGPMGISTYAFAGAFAVNVSVTLGAITASSGGTCGSFAAPSITLGNHAVVASASLSTTATAAATLGPMWCWGGQVSIGYFLYSSPDAGSPIDYDHPIGVTSALTFTTATGLIGPGDWRFGVRAASVNGEEQNLDCSLEIDIDSTGADVTNRPAAPNNLRAHASAGGSIVVAWSAAQTTVAAKKPTGFHVYIGTGLTPNYASPAATVLYGASIAGAYQETLSGLVDATTYSVGVRAYNASGEEANTTTVACTADAVGPSAVLSLVAAAVV